MKRIYLLMVGFILFLLSLTAHAVNLDLGHIEVYINNNYNNDATSVLNINSPATDSGAWLMQFPSQDWNMTLPAQKYGYNELSPRNTFDCNNNPNTLVDAQANVAITTSGKVQQTYNLTLANPVHCDGSSAGQQVATITGGNLCHVTNTSLNGDGVFTVMVMCMRY